MKFIGELSSLKIDHPLHADAEIRFKDFIALDNLEYYFYYKVI